MTGNATKLPSAGDYALLFLLGVIWGVSFVLIKIAVATIPPIPLSLIRISITALVMAGYLWWARERLPPPGRIWWYIALSALFGNSLPVVLVAWGQQTVDGSLAAILMSPGPLAAAVLAHFLTHDDKLNRHKLAGIALGVVGIAVLMGVGNLARLGADIWPQLIILAAGCMFGANAVINRGMSGGSAVSNVTAVMIVASALLLPLGLVPGSWSFSPSRIAIVAMLTLAIVSTSFGTVLTLHLVRRAGAAFTAQVNFLVPVFGVIFGALILGERPTANAIAGLALVLAGVAIARRGAGLRPSAPVTESARR